jgi:hypothetical protein
MKSKLLKISRRITQSPRVNVLVGSIFLGTGVIETVSTIDEVSIGVHHGAILYGILHTLKYLPDFIEGMEYVQKGDME